MLLYDVRVVIIGRGQQLRSVLFNCLVFFWYWIGYIFDCIIIINWFGPPGIWFDLTLDKTALILFLLLYTARYLTFPLFLQFCVFRLCYLPYDDYLRGNWLWLWLICLFLMHCGVRNITNRDILRYNDRNDLFDRFIFDRILVCEP